MAGKGGSAGKKSASFAGLNSRPLSNSSTNPEYYGQRDLRAEACSFSANQLVGVLATSSFSPNFEDAEGFTIHIDATHFEVHFCLGGKTQDVFGPMLTRRIKALEIRHSPSHLAWETFKVVPSSSSLPLTMNLPRLTETVKSYGSSSAYIRLFFPSADQWMCC